MTDAAAFVASIAGYVDQVNQVLDPVANILTVLALLGIPTAVLVGWFKWKRGVFKNIMNATLNVVSQDGYLELKGLYEGEVRELLSNRGVQKVLMSALHTCTLHNPFVLVRDRTSRRRLIRSLVMLLATRSGIEDKLKAYLGVESLEGLTFVNVQTFEYHGDDRDRMIRDFVVEKGTLKKFLNPEWVAKLKVHVDHHNDRIKWLVAMAELHFNGTTDKLDDRTAKAAKEMMYEVSW